jgi:hypothetical protein
VRRDMPPPEIQAAKYKKLAMSLGQQKCKRERERENKSYRMG